MYNLEVQGNHDFFVGEKEWLVHNGACDVFYVGRHGSMPTPRAGIFESHHGVMSKWMDSMFGKAYVADDAPAVLMALDNHNVTRGAYNTWRAAQSAAQGGSFSWSRVTEAEIRDLGTHLFDAAKVPGYARTEYWNQFNDYFSQLKQSTGVIPK